MPDPQVVYVVTAVVVAGLVAWVAIVLWRAPRAPVAPANGASPEAEGPPASKTG